jgi:hypothetical protein
MKKFIEKDNSISSASLDIAKARQQVELFKGIGWTIIIVLICFFGSLYIYYSYQDYKNTTASRRAEVLSDVLVSYGAYKDCTSELTQLEQQPASTEQNKIITSQKFKCSRYALEFASQLQFAPDYFHFDPQSKAEVDMMMQQAFNSDPMSDEILEKFSHSADQIVASLKKQSESLK